MEINDNFIKKDQVSQDSKEKPVESRRGPATVRGAHPHGESGIFPQTSLEGAEPFWEGADT